MTLTALCACQSTSISVNGTPCAHNICHCTNCKRRTGSAFGISTYFLRGQVVTTDGEMLVYRFHHAAQNHDQERHFCKHCGTTLFWHISTCPDLVGIAGGCFPDGSLAEPLLSAANAQKMAWLHLPENWQCIE